MNQLNSLILEGNLVRDSVLSEPVPGFKKCAFSVGVNRFYKNKKNEDVNEVSFFDVEAYGKMAEYCEEKAKKGRGVRVVGRLKQDTWKDSNGKSVSKVYVVAEHIEYRPVKKTEEVSEAADTKTLAEKAAEAATPPEPQTDVQSQTAEEEAVF
jgi:single-strand DNA-binding protein